MGLKDGFQSSSILIKISMILLLLAQFCSWIAFTVPEWAVQYTRSSNGAVITGGSIIGLWRSCGYSIFGNVPSSCAQLDGGNQAWFRAVQALAIFGFIGINVGFFILAIQMFASKLGGDVGFWNAVQCIVTAVCYLLAAIVFAVEFDSGAYGVTIGWSWTAGALRYGFGLAILAFLLELVAGILMIIDSKKSSGTSPA